MNYDKVWSLFNSENLSKRGMARVAGMSPSGFESMMDKKTMTVETLEKIAKYFKKEVHYFFDTSDRYTYVGSNQDIPEEPKITTYSCPDCIKKENTIKDLRKTIALQDELLERYRPKKEKGLG
nr:helix-turn-helix transcriptional regulator [uncultured Draconibacterium sp.]